MFKLLFKKKKFRKNVMALYFIGASKYVQIVNINYLEARREYMTASLQPRSKKNYDFRICKLDMQVLGEILHKNKMLS